MVLLLGVLLAGPILEADVAIGAAHSLETSAPASSSGYSYPFAAPLIQGRLTVEALDYLAIGGTVLAILGGEARNAAACCGDDRGNEAFSAAAVQLTIRLHSMGPTEYWL